MILGHTQRLILVDETFMVMYSHSSEIVICQWTQLFLNNFHQHHFNWECCLIFWECLESSVGLISCFNWILYACKRKRLCKKFWMIVFEMPRCKLERATDWGGGVRKLRYNTVVYCVWFLLISQQTITWWCTIARTNI